MARTADRRPNAAEVLPPAEGGWADPIVAEVRAIRAQLWAEAGGTLEGLVALLRRSEEEERRRAGTPSGGGDDA